MNLRKLNKKAGMESQEVIVWILVITVVFLAIIFVSKLDLSNLMKNLPGTKGPQEEDRTIDVDLEIDICPGEYGVVGYFERGKKEIFLYIKSGEDFLKTDIYLESGTNKVKLAKSGISPVIGEKIIGNIEVININTELFDRYSSIFKEILSIELQESKRIFYPLALIKDAEIKSANIVCQKKESIKSINKTLNELYFSEKDTEIIDLTSETEIRTSKQTIEIERRFWFNEKKEATIINLANYIYYASYEGYPNLKKLIIIKEEGSFNIYQYSDKKIWSKRLLFKVDNQGFLWFNNKGITFKEIRNTHNELEAIYVADEDYFGWTLDKKLKISSGATTENFIKIPILLDIDYLHKNIN